MTKVIAKVMSKVMSKVISKVILHVILLRFDLWSSLLLLEQPVFFVSLVVRVWCIHKRINAKHMHTLFDQSPRCCITADVRRQLCLQKRSRSSCGLRFSHKATAVILR